MIGLVDGWLDDWWIGWLVGGMISLRNGKDKGDGESSESN